MIHSIKMWFPAKSFFITSYFKFTTAGDNVKHTEIVAREKCYLPGEVMELP